MPDKNKISAREIAAVVHDVRQMLGVITGRAGLLRFSAENNHLKDDLGVMESAALQANAILSRLQQNSTTADSGGCDIFATLKQSALMMEPSPGVSWQLANPPKISIPGTWYFDADLTEGCVTTVPKSILLEVLNNLLHNALGVMPDGGQLQVNLERVQAFWQLRLQDSGSGIAPEKKDKIFEMGFSTSGDPDRGVGLSSCRDLLTLHGGQLELIETPQQGACFQLLLPYAAFQPEEKSETRLIRQGNSHPAVLVVDDDRAVREMLHDILDQLGCRVKVARDAPDATEILPTECFEMVIIDQTLPGKSGLEFAKGLRKQDPNLVLVLISGWGQEEILDKALGTVVDMVAEKPVTVEKIMELLDRAGELRHQRLKDSE